MNRYWTYILLCSDDSYYTGVTNKIRERFVQHQQGIDPQCYTYERRPLKLVWLSEFDDINDAIRCEKQIKGWSRRKKEALIRGDWKGIQTGALNSSNREKLDLLVKDAEKAASLHAI